VAVITPDTLLLPACCCRQRNRYVVKNRIDIRKSVVLRGAGKAATTLFFPNSLTEAHGNKGSWWVAVRVPERVTACSLLPLLHWLIQPPVP
jgi:hypothetical protein